MEGERLSVRLLLVEDDQLLTNSLLKILDRWFVTDHHSSLKGARRLIELNRYDLAIVDLALSDGHGATVVNWLRHYQPQTGILILTGEAEEQIECHLLDTAVDMFLRKPISSNLLIANLTALLRRQPGRIDDQLSLGDLALHPIKRLAFISGKQLRLGRREFDLLHYLVQNRERPVSRQELIEQVWGESIDPLTNVVDVHIRNLRRKLGSGRTGIIRTIHGVGYQARPNE